MVPVDDGVWCRESHFTVWGCSGSLRMTVIATARGSILYSPVALNDDDIDRITAAGPVAAIVAPNLYHHFYLRPAIAAFSSARVLVPPGLEAKIGPIPRAEVMDGERLRGLSDEIDHFIFRGHALRECVLFHRRTRTLVTADLLYNYQAEHRPAEKLFFRAIGCYGEPKVAFYHRYAIQDKASVGSLIETVRRWRPRRIVMCHGRIVTGEDAAERFAAAWSGFA